MKIINIVPIDLHTVENLDDNEESENDDEVHEAAARPQQRRRRKKKKKVPTNEKIFLQYYKTPEE